MSYPILYSATETNFDHNGIGILPACVSCEVTEEANGIFELAMTYPMDGVHFAEIGDRAIIKAKADQFRDPQLFRVYAISKPMSGIVTVLAEHISYDLSGIPVKPFAASTASSALAGLKSNAAVDCPFDFWTDKATTAKFSVKTPASIRSRLGGVAGSVLDVYGGEYEFDNYTVKLHNNRGMNRGVSIRYGKNLTDIKQDQNCSSVSTGVYPYWVNLEGKNLVELPEKIINAYGTYNFSKIRTLDLSSEFETQPTIEQLRLSAERYIKANEIGVPKVSLSVSFAQLEQTEEYKHMKLLERVSLFDTVNVEFPILGVSATAKAVKMVYDVLADRVKSVTLGSVRANIADTIATQSQQIEQEKDKPTLTVVQKVSAALTKEIMGAKGGTVRMIDTDGDGNPDELYIADNEDPAKAVKVWRFNYDGWAASKNGYAGPYTIGASFDTGILADFITAGILRGIEIIGESGSIGGFSMSANTLTSPYRKDYPEFTEDDLDKITAYYLGTVELTDAEIDKYDVNMNGRIDNNDAVIIRQMMNGLLPTYSVGRFTLNASDPKNTMVLEITEGYRAGEKTVIGFGGINSSAIYVDNSSASAPPLQVSSASELEPDVYRVFGEVSSLDVKLVEVNDGKAHEYCFEFVPTADFACLNITPEPTWATAPQYTAGKTCQVSILRGVGVMVSA